MSRSEPPPKFRSMMTLRELQQTAAAHAKAAANEDLRLAWQVQERRLAQAIDDLEEATPTPRPWAVEHSDYGDLLIVGGGKTIALLNGLDEAHANAAFIVQACNAYRAPEAPTALPTEADYDRYVARWIKNNSLWSPHWLGPEPGQVANRVPLSVYARHGLDPKTGLKERAP